MRDDPAQRGMILINVLIIVMLATAVLAVMLAGEDDDVQRSTAMRSAAQAMEIARGAELSAVAALRRDLAAGSMVDTLDEEWANIGDRGARIPGGRFTFTVSDAQSRFNINNLAQGGVMARADFDRIAQVLAIPPDASAALADALQANGPVGDISELRKAGLNDDQLRRLAEYCTALPPPTDVNINTAPESLLAILLSNEAIARRIVSERQRGAKLDGDFLASASALLPPGVGLTSDYFWARGKVTVGDNSQQLTSLLYRKMERGTPVVVAFRRWRGAAPVTAPPLPD